MFTIEQAGNIKKVNTIDELIIEYIKKYACQCNNGNNLGSSLNTEELKELLKPYAKLTNLDEYKQSLQASLNAYAKLTSLSEYAKAQDLQSYAKTTDLFDYLKTVLRNA